MVNITVKFRDSNKDNIVTQAAYARRYGNFFGIAYREDRVPRTRRYRCEFFSAQSLAVAEVMSKEGEKHDDSDIRGRIRDGRSARKDGVVSAVITFFDRPKVTVEAAIFVKPYDGFILVASKIILPEEKRPTYLNVFYPADLVEKLETVEVVDIDS